MVWKLHKDLYGLKQALRAWYERLHGYLVSIGFLRTNDNSSLYIKEGPQKKRLLEKIFVGDILFTVHDDLCKAFSEQWERNLKCLCFVKSNSLLVYKFIR